MFLKARNVLISPDGLHHLDTLGLGGAGQCDRGHDPLPLVALSPLDWSEEIMEDEAEEKGEQSADHGDAETWSVLETDVQF